MGKTMKKVILTLLFLTLSASTILLAYLHFFAPGEEDLSGEWIAALDMRTQAAATALDWLQDIEAVSLSLEEMEAYMQDLTIQVNLTLEQTSETTGTFHSSILPESYEACSQAAYEAFATAFLDLLAQRLHMAGFPESTDRVAMEALVEETFGMSTLSYLKSCGPALLPSLEEFQAWYDTEGTYQAVEGILTWKGQSDSAGAASTTISQHYIRKGSRLVLIQDAEAVPPDHGPVSYPMVYTLKTEGTTGMPPKDAQ